MFIIPVRLEDFKPPNRLSKWQYADYFEGQRERAFGRLVISLKMRADSLGLKYGQQTRPQKKKPIEEIPTQKKENKPEANRFEKSYARAQKLASKANERVQKNIEGRKPVEALPSVRPEYLSVDQILSNKITLSNGMEFMHVPAGKFLMGSKKENRLAYDDEFPQHIVDIPYDYWMARFPVTNELYSIFINTKQLWKHPVDGWTEKKAHPVTNVFWENTIAYCKWLNSLFNKELPNALILRLPTEAEWEKSARGTDGREYPWGIAFDKNRCNTKGIIVNVGSYSPIGDTPYGCADMSGNVCEWTHSLKKEYPYKLDDGRESEKETGRRILRGGSFIDNEKLVRCASRIYYLHNFYNTLGFRVCIAPPLPE